LHHGEINSWKAKLETESLGDLEAQEESGWEVVRIESMEKCYTSYGFRSSYNGLVVGGLPSLEMAKSLKKLKMVTSYIEQELARQFY
jgi:hypothetical protein